MLLTDFHKKSKKKKKEHNINTGGVLDCLSSGTTEFVSKTTF